MIARYLRTASVVGFGFLVLAFYPAKAQDLAAQHAFAKEAVTEIRARVPEAKVAMEPGDPLQINITEHPVWDEGVVNLHRIYNFCLTAAEEDCEVELDRLIGTLTREEEPQFGPENLRIAVRDAEYWNYVTRTLPADSIPVHRQIGDDLFAILVLDSPDAISIAQPDQIAEMGLTFDQAWDLASEQTAAIIPAFPSDQASMIVDGIVAFEGDEYVATILLDIERWTAISEIVGPDMVVVAVSDQLAAAANFPAGELLEGFKQAVRDDCAAAARCVSPNTYRFRGGRWVLAD